MADEGARNPTADMIGKLNIGPGPPGGDGAAEAPGWHLNDLVAAVGGFAIFTDGSGLSAGENGILVDCSGLLTDGSKLDVAGVEMEAHCPSQGNDRSHGEAGQEEAAHSLHGIEGQESEDHQP